METRSTSSHPDEFYIGRMVNQIGLVNIAAMTSLAAAMAQIRELTKFWPGEYIVFHRNTGRVLARSSRSGFYRSASDPTGGDSAPPTLTENAHLFPVT